MATVSLPYNISNGTVGDADQVMANFQSITSVVNGALGMGGNVQADAPINPITGNTSSEGTSVNGLRADAQFVLQGFENLAADPTTDNFEGRIYWNTATPALRICTDETGIGTFEDLSQAAATLVVHAAQHKAAGHDPLANETITDDMMASRTINTATIAATIGATTGIPVSAWTTIVDLALTSTGLQTYWISVSLRVHSNTTVDPRSVYGRVVDVTDSDTTIGMSTLVRLGHENTDSETAMIAWSFPYTVPATGARTLRVAVTAGSGDKVEVQKQGTVQTDTFVPPTITAVVI